MWGTVSPARAPISSKTGTGVNGGLEDGFADWPQAATTKADEIRKQQALLAIWRGEEL
jgi:hypothetical protein